jgi:hypothetical protein
MVILFLIISLLISLGFVYCIGRLMFSHIELINIWKIDIILFCFHLMGVFMITIVIFVTLCAINNTFLHIPY